MKLRQLSLNAQQDYQLVRQALNKGDQRSFAKLLEKYKDSIHHMLFCMVHNSEIAEDLTIEAYGKAFRNLHTYVPGYAFSTWLFKIAVNHCIDFIRCEREKYVSSGTKTTIEYQEETLEIFDYNSNPEEKLIEKQKIAMMRDVISKLKPRYKTLIELRYFGGYSYEEIAKELNISIDQVKVQLNRGKQFIYSIIQVMKGKI